MYKFDISCLRKTQPAAQGRTGELGSCTRKKKIPARKSVSFKEGTEIFCSIVFDSILDP